MQKRMNQHGLGAILVAGQVCMQAEKLYPGLFKAVSLKNGCLHLEILKKDQLKLTMIQGKLINDLQTYAKAHNLPEINRIRLTFSTE